MRHTAAEKYETIRLVEGSDLPVRRTLRELQVNPVYVLYVVSPLHGARTAQRCERGDWRPRESR